MKSRAKIILTISVLVVIALLLFSNLGRLKFWDLTGVEQIRDIYFGDLTSITYGAESFKQGFDPMIDNPFHPHCTRATYPRIWQSLYSLGVNRSHTMLIGLIFIISYLVAICLVSPNLNNVGLFLVALALLSYSSLLAIERGNNDMFAFFLVGLSVWLIKRSTLGSVLVLLTAFALKLFPLFAFPLLLRLNRKKFLMWGLVVIAFVIFYVVLNFSDLAALGRYIPRPSFYSQGYSYGLLGLDAPSSRLAFIPVPFICAALLLILAFSLTALSQDNQILRLNSSASTSVYLDAFRAGAGIYIGTFLVFTSFSYRLIFLIFTLPQLVFWLKMKGKMRIIFKLITAIVILSLFDYPMALPRALKYLNLVFFEAVNWLVFASFSYLFIWTLPKWSKDLIIGLPYVEDVVDYMNRVSKKIYQRMVLWLPKTA